MAAAVAIRTRLPFVGRSRDDAAGVRARTDRRGSARARRGGRPRRVRRPLPALRSSGARARAAAARRPRPGRGRRAGGVRVDLARRAHATAASAARSLRGCTPSRGTRSPTAAAPAPARSRRPSRPTRRRTSPARPSSAEQSWVAYRVHRAMEDLPETERACSSSPTGAACRRARSRTSSAIPLGTVKTRTRSGLRRLAEELEEELG